MEERGKGGKKEKQKEENGGKTESLSAEGTDQSLYTRNLCNFTNHCDPNKFVF